MTDVDLGPGPNGWMLARRARQEIADIPVIYATGDGGDFACEGVAAGRLVGKPYAPQHLAHVARAMLTGR